MSFYTFLNHHKLIYNLQYIYFFWLFEIFDLKKKSIYLIIHGQIFHNIQFKIYNLQKTSYI